MRLAAIVTTLALALAPIPALASSCAEQIATIERRLDSAGAVEIAGLQPVRSLQTGSPRGVQAARLDAPSDPSMVPTAGGMAVARTLMHRAGDEGRRGDQRACEDSMTEARGMIGALP